MIDFFFRWNSQADARADAIALAQRFGSLDKDGLLQWARDHVLPNVKAWRPSQDSGSPVVHVYLPGWFAIVSLETQPAVLLNASALAFALNREGPPYIIKNNIGAVITDVACEPIFAGSHYPIGGYA